MIEDTPVHISLTRLLSRIQDKSVLLKDCLIPSFNMLSHPLVNPYPEWVSESKSWGIFGTFSDYVIRKILLNLFPDKIKLYYILAAHTRQILFDAIDDTQYSTKTFLTKQLMQDYNLNDLKSFYKMTEYYIDNYRNSSVSWI